MPLQKPPKVLMIVTLLMGLGILLPGCAASNNAGTLDAGAALPQAQYQVLGKTRYDQTWIDKTIEGEVAGFGFKRPVKRPASFDAAPVSHAVVVLPPEKPVIPVLTPATPPVVTVVPRPSWSQRIKAYEQKQIQRVKNLRKPKPAN